MLKPLLTTAIVAIVLYGCSDPEALPELISTPGTVDNISPSASFTSSCNNLDCNFDASASADADGSIVNYSWDFGDNNSGGAWATTHSYAIDGSYVVILTVTDNDGASSSSSKTMSVSSGNIPPAASFASDCPDLNCSFDAGASADADGSIVDYSWDFGDGTTGSGVVVNHSFNIDGDYTVNMTVTDSSGASSSSSLTVSVSAGGGNNNPPSASFTSDCPDLNCSFDASASSDSDGAIVSYSWDFGDGAVGNTVTPNHTYATDGSYTVVLTVSDNAVPSANSTSTQTLFVTSGNSSPSAAFTTSCIDLDCNFDASNSSDSDGSIVSYDWIFGDSATGSGVTANHNYLTDGSYSVMLTVTDDAGASSSGAQSITVSAANNIDGQALFNNKCSTCHGADAQGGTLAKIDLRGKTAIEIRNAINTIQQMSSQSSLTDEDVQAIADYLGTL